MDSELIKANLNLYAILINLEDLAVHDRDIASLIKDWNIAIQFIVRHGPCAYIIFKYGTCSVGKGRCKRPSIKLYFHSPEKLNKMFEGKSNPMLLKGFTKLKFLTKEFPKLTTKLEYYMRPTPELLEDKNYLELNTRLTLHTAAFAICELSQHDSIGKANASHIKNGAMLLKVLPNGPAVHIIFKDGAVEAGKGEITRPMSAMFFKNSKIANDLLNQKIDAFAAVATGDVMLQGHVSMIDAIGRILTRIPIYLP